jgi:hypothetical protein
LRELCNEFEFKEAAPASIEEEKKSDRSNKNNKTRILVRNTFKHGILTKEIPCLNVFLTRILVLLFLLLLSLFFSSSIEAGAASLNSNSLHSSLNLLVKFEVRLIKIRILILLLTHPLPLLKLSYRK